MNQVQLLAGDPRAGHITSSQVTKTLTSITPDRIELELYADCHCLSCHDATADMQHDLPGSFIGQLFKLTYRDRHAYSSMCFAARNLIVLSISIFSVRKLFFKKLILLKAPCLFDLPWNVKMLRNVVRSVMAGFRTSQTFRSSLLRSSTAIRGQMT